MKFYLQALSIAFLGFAIIAAVLMTGCRPRSLMASNQTAKECRKICTDAGAKQFIIHSSKILCSCVFDTEVK